MKTKIIIAGVVTVLLLAVTFKLKSNKHTVDANVYRPDPEKRILVQGVAAESRNLDQAFSYTGTFAPFREVMLIPQVHGEVETVYFDEGDQVRKGKTLVQIDDDLLQAQFTSAEANYNNAKRNLERYQNASNSGGVSAMQLDNLKLALTNAESQFRQLSKQIALSRITAPFDGTMTLRSVEPGSVVGSSAIARITDIAQLKLEITVPEKEIVLFREGENAQVETDIYPGRKFSGKIEYVSDRADNSHNYTVRILLKNNDAALKAGMYGTAVLKKGMRKNTLIIPRAALLGSAKNPQVFVVIDGKAVLKNIQTGLTSNESVEVVEGIIPGDVVVTTGHINLTDGSNVEIAK